MACRIQTECTILTKVKEVENIVEKHTITQKQSGEMERILALKSYKSQIYLAIWPFTFDSQFCHV